MRSVRCLHRRLGLLKPQDVNFFVRSMAAEAERSAYFPRLSLYMWDFTAIAPVQSEFDLRSESFDSFHESLWRDGKITVIL